MHPPETAKSLHTDRLPLEYSSFGGDILLSFPDL